MTGLAYAAPDSVGAAIRLLTDAQEARPLAGGSDLLVQLRSGRFSGGLLVDLKHIPALHGIRGDAASGFVIGAATPLAEIVEHDALAAAWPGVVEAAGLIGSVQIRGRATLAGNLCNASPAADSVPALIAAGAVALIVGPRGSRELAVAAVPSGPGVTMLAPGEIVVGLRLPPQPARAADAYQRITPRTEMDIAVVGCGVWLALAADGTVRAARLALGAVAPTALEVPAAAQALLGRRPATALEDVAAAARAACRPIDDKRGTAAYRRQVAGVLARRVVQQAAMRAEQHK